MNVGRENVFRVSIEMKKAVESCGDFQVPKSALKKIGKYLLWFALVSAG